jgi:hypothetical protein
VEWVAREVKQACVSVGLRRARAEARGWLRHGLDGWGAATITQIDAESCKPFTTTLIGYKNTSETCNGWNRSFLLLHGVFLDEPEASSGRAYMNRSR